MAREVGGTRPEKLNGKFRFFARPLANFSYVCPNSDGKRRIFHAVELEIFWQRGSIDRLLGFVACNSRPIILIESSGERRYIKMNIYIEIKNKIIK